MPDDPHDRAYPNEETLLALNCPHAQEFLDFILEERKKAEEASPFPLRNIKVGEKDQNGRTVDLIYHSALPDYIIYRAGGRVTVCYRDEPPSYREEQRAKITELMPSRCKIAILATKTRWKNYYDGQVASAIQVALDKDVDTAMVVLEEARLSLQQERVKAGRQHYLVAAGVAAGGAAGFLGLAGAGSVSAGLEASSTSLLYMASAGGALGAVFSIATALKSRTAAPSDDKTANIIDASIRVLVGILSGFALMLLALSGIVDGIVGDGLGLSSNINWEAAVAVGFVAGFSERLVPDMLNKVETVKTNGGGR